MKRVMGPVWPALYTAGLRVSHSGASGIGTLIPDPEIGWLVVWDSAPRMVESAGAYSLRIDYSDLRILDHAARVVAKALGWPEGVGCERWLSWVTDKGRWIVCLKGSKQYGWQPQLDGIDATDPEVEYKAIRAVVAQILGNRTMNTRLPKSPGEDHD